MAVTVHRTQLTVVTHSVLFAKEIPQFACGSIPILLSVSLCCKYYLGRFTATVTDPYKSGIRNQFIPDISC